MLDGRHTGTGGGNHIVIGGPTPVRRRLSPAPSGPAAQPRQLLAQPSVALVFVLWLVHRPDQPASARGCDARHDSIYELELAFKNLPAAKSSPPIPPWLVDRLLRRLLIVRDPATTAPREFCIDKLYSP